jgi:type I restriction enzyme S subunit
VTGKHFTSGFIDFESCYKISEAEHLKVMKRSKPEPGDILFSNIGTLGSIAIVPESPVFSIKNVALFKPLNVIHSSFLYLHFASPETQRVLAAKASGTSQKFYSLYFLRSLRVATPPDELLASFEQLVKVILQQELVLNSVNTNLRQTRDLLLPKLVSGEVSVENLEQEALAETV